MSTPNKKEKKGWWRQLGALLAQPFTRVTPKSEPEFEDAIDPVPGILRALKKVQERHFHAAGEYNSVALRNINLREVEKRNAARATAAISHLGTVYGK